MSAEQDRVGTPPSPSGLQRTHLMRTKGGVAVTEAVKILALPRRGAGGSDPCQDFSGGIVTVHRGYLKVIIPL